MTTTRLSFSPSINILRDSNYQFNYIPTQNAEKVFELLLSDAIAGVKCHTIIGAYGTGKSSFLLAYKQTLLQQQVHFVGKGKLIRATPAFEYMQFVGDVTSFSSCFAKELGIKGDKYNTARIIEQLSRKYERLQTEGKGIAIVVDEFGKLLEYAARNNPEVELYFIQQLCEWVNETNKKAVFITTLHQDFNSYSFGLSKTQQQEWSKVKGRFKELMFNEPVEQLLFLAAERMGQVFKHLEHPNYEGSKIFEAIKSSKAFPLRDYFTKPFAQKLYPFDILSAAVLTISLQRYGQNERSLFSFIEANNHLSIKDFAEKKQGYYGLDKVYDYLMANYLSAINNRIARSDSAMWRTIRIALEKTEGVLPEKVQGPAQQALKCIGLLNIFTSAAAKLDLEFYETYLQYAVGIANPDVVVAELEKYKIIKYAKHSSRYVMLDGTDLDIDLAIDEAGNIIERGTNIVEILKLHFDIAPIAAKEISYTTGTPRFFRFVLSDHPLVMRPEDEIDGFINLVFNEDADMVNQIRQKSKDCEEAILFGYFNNGTEIRNVLFEIQKAKQVKTEHINDHVAVKELDAIIKHYTYLLNHHVLDNLYANSGRVNWYYQGRPISITNRKAFNRQLSAICQAVYPGTPYFKNELINKTKTSSAISSARKALVVKMLENADEANLGFSADKFPPEKTIYLSLLEHIGIHADNGLGIWGWQRPTASSFQALWQAGERFLETTKEKERNLTDFIELLLNRPFKLKQGFIDFWIPVFLIAKADEYALFDGTGYIPALNVDVLELINKRPEQFRLKAFDLSGVKLELLNRYRLYLSQPESARPGNKVFIQTIKPFLSFYRELTDYAKHTKNISRQAIAIRQAISQAKDPEKIFFEDFPTALGYSIQELQQKPKLAEAYIKKLQEAIRELCSCYDMLINRVDHYVTNEVLGTNESFPAYRKHFVTRYQHLKPHLLKPSHKSFHTRLLSPLDDKNAWLSSLAQACVGKPMKDITDEDELLFCEKFSDAIYELDNLVEISKLSLQKEEKDVLKLEITSLVDGLNKSLLHLPNRKSKEITQKQGQIKAMLGKDKTTNIAILAYLLKDYMSHE